MDETTLSEPDEEESDDARLERLRNDPNVIVHRGSGKPFVPEVGGEERTDELWLIGRRKTEWIDDEDYRGAVQLKGSHAMAQTQPAKFQGESREAWLERLRSDPRVTVHRGSGKPFVSDLRVKEGTDLMWLLGRTDDDEEDEVVGQDDSR